MDLIVTLFLDLWFVWCISTYLCNTYLVLFQKKKEKEKRKETGKNYNVEKRQINVVYFKVHINNVRKRRNVIFNAELHKVDKRQNDVTNDYLHQVEK